MKIIVSGGGTGGHIYPAITLLRTVEKLCPGAEILYVGTPEGLEADIIPKEGLPFETVELSGGFKRSLSPANIVRAFQAGCGVLKAMSIVRRFQPDVAVGTGGYVCGPILLAASLLGVPTLIQEQNVMPGITNKALSRFVSRIALGAQEAEPYFPKGKCVFTGNPIRAEVMAAEREEGLKSFGLDPDKLTVLVSGGSRGARSINRAMLTVLKKYAGSDEVQILHVTGKSGYAEVMEGIRRARLKPDETPNIQVKPYLYDMPKALACADLAIFRAGAIGIAEMTARGIPSILVPYPYAAENHQEHNARAIEKAGAAKVIIDKELNGELLAQELEKLLSDREGLKKMAEASRSLGRPEAAQQIAQLIIEEAKKK